MSIGEKTRTEIESQPEIWQATYEKIIQQKDRLEARLSGLKNRPWIVIGCGSTYYAAVHAVAVLRSHGVQAWAQPSSEVVFFPQGAFAPQSHPPVDSILLVISRSGTTTESLWAMEAYRKQHPSGIILSISCVPGTPMIAGSDIALVSEAAQEQSVAQTRSFTSMILMVQMLSAILIQDQKRLAQLMGQPAVLRKLFERYHDRMEAIGRDPGIERIFFLVSGLTVTLT